MHEKGVEYTSYKLSLKEMFDFYLAILFFCIMLGMIFYDNVLSGLLLFCFSPMLEPMYSSYLLSKRKQRMKESFKNILYSVAAEVAAGRQMPRAIYEASVQEAELSCEEDIIVSEMLELYETYLSANIAMDVLIDDLANRSGITEMKLFAKAYKVCQSCGGDLEFVCLRNAYLLIQQMEYEKELQTVLAEKKADIIILVLMPLLVLIILNFTAYDYINPLYHCLKGRLIMSSALVMMIFAFLWGKRIMNVKL